MAIPRRIRARTGRYSLVDGIPFQLPVQSRNSPALMAAFPIDADAARKLISSDEIQLLRWGKTGFLLVTVIDYRETNIGKYIEYSIGIACTHGSRRVPLPLAMIFQKTAGTGQYVIGLPVSSLISVKGGKGIWGMPKHQGNLDFIITDETVSSRYDLDGKMIMKIEIQRPKRAWIPLRAGGANYCSFRGMLMKSSIYFRGKLGVKLGRDVARITLGDHPRARALESLSIGRPLFAGYFPSSNGVLDDHLECWFESFPSPPAATPEGMESVIDLPLSEEWLPPPGSPEASRGAGAREGGNVPQVPVGSSARG